MPSSMTYSLGGAFLLATTSGTLVLSNAGGVHAAAFSNQLMSSQLFDSFDHMAWTNTRATYNTWQTPGKMVAATMKVGADTDGAMYAPDAARKYAATTTLKTPVDYSKVTVLQYEVRPSSGWTCGGAYLKFYNETGEDEDFDASAVDNNTPYSVMFGPDKCGTTNKVHLIFRRKSLIDGSIEEKHLKDAPLVPSDSNTHVYTAVIDPVKNHVKVLVDGEEKASGSIFEAFDPPFNPPKEIDDPEDKKPEDWIDDDKMDDPDATKPDDWDEDAPMEIEDEKAEKPEGWLDDEPEQIPDPEAEQPEDWDEEEDGEWEAPMIKNPACDDVGCGEWEAPMKPNPDYKGKWYPPRIPNPAYKGPWAPRKIPNPAYFEDDAPLKSVGKIAAVGAEIWTMDGGLYFDNLLITDDEAIAEELRLLGFEPKQVAQKAEADAETDKKKPDAVPFLAGHLYELLENPALEQVKPHLKPVVDFFMEFPAALYILIVALPLLILSCVYTVFCMPSSSSSDEEEEEEVPAAQAKKEDATGKDDAAEEEEEEEAEEKEAEEKKSTRRRTRRA